MQRNSAGQLVEAPDTSDVMDEVGREIESTEATSRNPDDIFKVQFRGKVYPVVDYQYSEPSVGILTGYLTFCPINAPEEGYTCDFPEADNMEVNVHDGKGKNKGKATIIKVVRNS